MPKSKIPPVHLKPAQPTVALRLHTYQDMPGFGWQIVTINNASIWLAYLEVIRERLGVTVAVEDGRPVVKAWFPNPMPPRVYRPASDRHPDF